MRRSALLGAAGWGWPHKTLLVGWSMPDWPPEKTVAGVENEILGRWTARSTWAEVAAADYLSGTELPGFVAAHPDRAVDLGVPLIPHDLPSTQWNSELDAVIAGSHDTDHRSLGASLAALGARTVYARPWWEFDMGGDLTVGGTPDVNKFIGAWQRAIPNIRAGFASVATTGQSLKILYCPLPDRDDWATSYPGDSVVDVITSDIYGKVYSNVDPTQADMLAEVNGYLANLAAFGAAHGKPVAVSEWANCSPKGNTGVYDNRGCGDCPAYIDAMFDWALNPNNNVLYLCFYDSPDASVGIDLDSAPLSKARFVARAQGVQCPSGPNAPTIGTATPGYSSCVVSFTPATAGARPATFTATASPGGATGTGTFSPIRVSGLTTGASYTFTVHATNATGNSAESAVSNSATVLTPVTYAADDFNRADGAVGSTPTGGYVWTQIGGSGASWTISSDQLRGVGGGQHVFVVDDGQSDGTVQITRISGNVHDYLTFRCVDNSNYWQLVPSPYDGYFHISKQVAGTWTDFGTGPVPYAVVGGETMSVVLSGHTIIGKVNGTTVFNITDSDLSTATKHGVGTDGLSSPPNLFDNFSHTSVNT
jgi:hypothetical protein